MQIYSNFDYLYKLIINTEETMKRLLTVMLILGASLSLYAQGNDTKAIPLDDLYSPKSVANEASIKPGDVERFHGRLIHSNTNTYLNASEVTNDFYKKYVNAQQLQNWGQYIWGLGVSYAVSSMVYCIFESNPFGEGFVSRHPGVVIGAACGLVGGIMDYAGWAKLGSLADTYNKDTSVRRGYSLNFGATRSGGFGLALNF